MNDWAARTRKRHRQLMSLSKEALVELLEYVEDKVGTAIQESEEALDQIKAYRKEEEDP